MAKRLPLHERHAALGALFRETDGVDVPARYAGVVEEVRAVRERAGLADRSSRGRLEILGQDRVEFLHGQSSNDVKALVPGQGHLTTFLTGKGKMRGDGVVHALPDRFLVTCEGSAAAAIQKHLEHFVIMEDVRIVDAGETMVELGVHGPQATAEIEAALDLRLPDDLPEHHFVTVLAEGAKVMIAASRATGEPGYALFLSVDAADGLWRRLRARLPPIGLDALEVLRVEAGLPRFGIDMDENTIPIEAGLERAVSYTKGCYTGNEVILRLKTYGHVNRLVTGLVLDAAPPARGDRVFDGDREVGQISSAVHSPTLKAAVALAMVRRESAVPGTTLAVHSGGAIVAARVTPLPFVRRSP